MRGPTLKTLAEARAYILKLADAARPGDDEIAAGADPFAGGELAEESTIEAAGGTIVDILDAGGLAKARDSCARLEAFLASQRGLVFEQQGEPLRVFEARVSGLSSSSLKPFAMPCRPSACS